MTIHYKPLNIKILSQTPLFMISDIDNRGESTLVIKISGVECHYVFVGGKRYRAINGRAEINPRDVENGMNEVTFISGTKKLVASPFLKSVCGIERCPIDSAAVKSLENLLVSLAGRIEDAESRISVLEEKTIPKSILTFE
jgi:hypothetical protein